MLCLGSHPKGANAVLHMPASCSRAHSCDDSGGNVRIVWLAGDPHFAAAIATHTASRAHEGLRSTISVRQRSSPAFWHVCAVWNLLGCQTLLPSGCPRFGTQLVDVGRWDATFVPHSGFALVETNSGIAPQTLCQRVVDHLDTFRREMHITAPRACVAAPWIPMENSSGINGSPCSPPSAWEIVCCRRHPTNCMRRVRMAEARER